MGFPQPKWRFSCQRTHNPSPSGPTIHLVFQHLQPVYMPFNNTVTPSATDGEETGDGDIARLSPLMHGHINMLGHYTFTLPEDILKGEMRILNFNLNNELSP
ncbi:hypothetical protein E0I86_19975 [Salmonella enterica subsp. enterica serovar London]|nr:hypothetical protein [Salmonella enterica]ECB4377411.1 hypothetical protein [Salmonella enterica subsp. enterica serovar London]ECD3788061.1 hypothetical protein [Salmonella enterica subsp. enterica serovar Kandla]EDG5205628.1 hypothetical protein [Salmonella enterica subsp. enterica serovar Derby]EEJ9069189.1 hypothetical protein [Salmonella enterica subsp. enterica]EEM6791577.1 hypothetical protein [Salmonella enterica subsp. enterica serovar Poona]